MMVIETNAELRFEHLISLRKKISQTQMQEEMQGIQAFIEDKGLIKIGPVITTTFAVEQSGGITLLDTEILMPLDNDFESSGDYMCKKRFYLVNAVCIHHVGSPAGLQNSYNELTTYIAQNKLQPITSGYNVTISEPKPGESMDDFKIDVYIGVNPSVL